MNLRDTFQLIIDVGKWITIWTGTTVCLGVALGVEFPRDSHDSRGAVRMASLDQPQPNIDNGRLQYKALEAKHSSSQERLARLEARLDAFSKARAVAETDQTPSRIATAK